MVGVKGWTRTRTGRANAVNPPKGLWRKGKRRTERQGRSSALMKQALRDQGRRLKREREAKEARRHFEERLGIQQGFQGFPVNEVSLSPRKPLCSVKLLQRCALHVCVSECHCDSERVGDREVLSAALVSVLIQVLYATVPVWYQVRGVSRSSKINTRETQFINPDVDLRPPELIERTYRIYRLL